MAEDPRSDEEDAQQDIDDGEFPFLPPDHPLMDKVHGAMSDVLTKENQRVSLKLAESKEEYKKLVKHREEIGVTLYGAQQQLAKLQLQLEQLHDKYANLSSGREQEEEMLKKVTQDHEAKKKEVEDAYKRLQKSQDELNQLNVTNRQVEEYNEQMKQEIAVTRRATYKAEDHIKQTEKVKQKQDLLVDNMNEAVKRFSEEKSLLEAQLIAQKQETEAATQTLRDATREMEAIEFEKKQLLQQWRSSLVGMQRRDEALRDIQTALDEQGERELAIENEIRGLHTSIRREQERHEKLTVFKDKNDKEQTHLSTSMVQIKQDREKLLESYNMYQKATALATEETEAMKTQLRENEQQMAMVEKSVQKVSRDITGLCSKIEDQVSEQTTSDRAAANSKKRIAKIREETAAKEVETENLHNEIARVTVDSLNTQAHNQMLKERYKQLGEDLGQREKLIEQYEQEIRKRHHQIEKKQLYVDRLNREFDEKRTKLESEAGEGDVAGPQEAKLKHMKKTIDDLKKDCEQMQKDWIQKQTQLLQISTEQDNLRAKNTDMRNRKMVLQQKKLRIETQFESQKKEIKELDNAKKHLRFDMQRMTTALMNNDNKSKDLANNNLNMETEFVAKLKELEGQCLRMESEIETVKDESENMNQDIMEAERQVMLWERKIALEKEMQEALDPNIGQSESSAMSKEIHRMELRLDQLKRRQEQMISEMQRVIYKRDAIAMKYEPKAKKSKQASNTANTKRQIQSLRNNLRLCTQATTDAESQVQQRQQDLDQLQANIEQHREECNRREEMAEELRRTVQLMTVERQQKLAQESKLKQAAKRLEDFARGRDAPASNARSQIAEQRILHGNITEIVRQLYMANPAMEELWLRFFDWLEVPAPTVVDT